MVLQLAPERVFAVERCKIISSYDFVTAYLFCGPARA